MKATFPQIHTSRLTLRQVTNADLAHLPPISFYDGIPLKAEADILEMITKINGDMQVGQSIHWGIEVRATAILIGTVGFYRGFAHNSGEIGYVLNPNYEKQGFMYEALMAILKYGFTQLRLLSIVAFTERANLPSIKLLEKAAFTQVVTDKNDYNKYVLIAT